MSEYETFVKNLLWDIVNITCSSGYQDPRDEIRQVTGLDYNGSTFCPDLNGGTSYVRSGMAEERINAFAQNALPEQIDAVIDLRSRIIAWANRISFGIANPINLQTNQEEILAYQTVGQSQETPFSGEINPNQLLAQIATAQHYAQLMTIASNPTMLLSDSLALDGQELSDEEREFVYHRWLVHFLSNNRDDFDYTNYNDLTIEQLEDIARRKIITQIQHVMLNGRRQNDDAAWQRYLRNLEGTNPNNYQTWSIPSLISELNYFLTLDDDASYFLPQQRLVADYYDYQDQAQIEAILEDWDQESEQALLDELNALIGEMPLDILGTDVNWVIRGVADYYGSMKARHEMLSELIRPEQEARAERYAQDAAARELYFDYLSQAVDAGIRDADDWAYWQGLSTSQLGLEAEKAANELGISVEGYNTNDFATQHLTIYGFETYRGLREMGLAAMLVLSFVPMVGTALDIIVGVNALRQGDWLGVAFSLIGPIGDAVRAMKALRATGDVAAGILRASDEVVEITDSILDARRQLREGILEELSQQTDELDEIAIDLEQRRALLPPDKFDIGSNSNIESISDSTYIYNRRVQITTERSYEGIMRRYSIAQGNPKELEAILENSCAGFCAIHLTSGERNPEVILEYLKKMGITDTSALTDDDIFNILTRGNPNIGHLNPIDASRLEFYGLAKSNIDAFSPVAELNLWDDVRRASSDTIFYVGLRDHSIIVYNSTYWDFGYTAQQLEMIFGSNWRNVVQEIDGKYHIRAYDIFDSNAAGRGLVPAFRIDRDARNIIRINPE